MSYDDFQKRVNDVVQRSKAGVEVFFSEDDEGRMFANCSDGTTIIGNKKCLKVQIRWGSGHTALASI